MFKGRRRDVSDDAAKTLAELRAALDHVLTRDRGCLIGQWRRFARARKHPGGAAYSRLAAAIERSVDERRMRLASVPAFALDSSLPIADKGDEIVDLIKQHRVVVLAGETGSGKSTQLPKLCLAANRGVAGMIGCTQPRRVAARALARRVAFELDRPLGGVVGFQVRFAEQVGRDTLIKFMTDGILLAETQSDPWLAAYDTIIIDEAHERSLNVDFLLGYLKRLLTRRRDLKLLVTSATIDTARFAAHFDGAPIVEIEGRAHPVEIRWRPPDAEKESESIGRGPRAGAQNANSNPARRGDPGPAEQIVAVIDEISASDPHGDVLVFLPGEREIRDTHLALGRRNYRVTEILPLYARLSGADQDRVFRPGPARRIVLATNVAETSLTVPRIRYVIDSGTARVKRYSQRRQLDRLRVEPISQAAADQRKGRCGRLGPGICYRLYSEDDFAARPRYTDPEIVRSSLAGVILRMLSLRLGDPADFPFVEAPDERAVGDGYRRLAEIGAIDAERRLNEIGRRIARWPVDVALARMLIEADRLGVTAELLVLVAFLAIPDPRERPADARAQADAAHAQFVEPKSDFLGVLKLWRVASSAHEDLTQARLREWCRVNFLSFLRLREWRELHRQLLLIAESDRAAADAAATRRSPAVQPESRKEAERRYEAIHRCLLSGWPTQVARKDESGHYRGTRERRFAIFPGSALTKSPPQWLLAGEIIDIGKVYAMGCARIEPLWIEQQAAHLVKRSWRDPHFSRRRGAVMATEQVGLFGLVLIAQRKVRFDRQDAVLSHQIFLREALAACAIDARADFIRANARVLSEAIDIEAKCRRGGLVRSAEELAAFFKGKLPVRINNTAALDGWYRNAAPAARAGLHWSLADIMSETPTVEAADFPLHLTLAGARLKLEYRLVPGDAADGVTLVVPLALLNALPKARCEWLVPGLLPQRVAALIRGLPKSLRRNFVPAPDFARAFIECARARDEPLAVVLADYLQRVTGVALTAGDFAASVVPDYLRMRFRVVDDAAQSVAEGRDLASIQRDFSAAARDAFSRRTEADLERDDIYAFDFDEIPASVPGVGELIAYPALVDLGDRVALRVFEHANHASAAHRRGVERLLRRALADVVKRARRQLPIGTDMALQWLPLGSLDALRSDLIEAALNDVLGAHRLDIRQRTAFDRVKDEAARELFATAIERLRHVEAVIGTHAQLRPWLEPPMVGFAGANYDDLRAQLDLLLHPGFVRDTELARLAQFPRYLQAMHARALRLRQDPLRDQSRMLIVQGYWRDYLDFMAAGDRDAGALADLRWMIEELRVSMFAQELGTPEPVSPKRLARTIDILKKSGA
ncbi:MAG: ATP-dependent RNA helicase HrpA [Rhodanobacteraceae bacterium]